MEPLRTQYADDLDGLDDLLDGLDDPDAILAALADRTCRRTLLALRDGTGAVASLDALASDCHVGHCDDVAATATRLHHLTLPRLDDAGLLEYDPGSRTIRYRQRSSVETLLDAVESGGR